MKRRRNPRIPAALACRKSLPEFAQQAIANSRKCRQHFFDSLTPDREKNRGTLCQDENGRKKTDHADGKAVNQPGVCPAVRGERKNEIGAARHTIP